MIAGTQARPRGARGLLAGLSDRRRWHEPDYWLVAILLTLLMFGTVMVFSASFAIGVRQEEGNDYFYLIRQLMWVAVGLTGMAVTYSIDYRVWRRFSVIGMLGVLGLLGAVLVIGVGDESWGAQRWIPLGPLSFQPAEIAKPVLVIYLADWLGQKGAKIRQFNYGLIPFSIFLGLLIGLVMLQPDMGTSIVLAAIGIGMFLVVGADLWHIGLLMSSGLVSFLMLALSATYRRNRILIFLDPDRDPLHLGYQLNQARYALGSGGIFGLGLGNSRQKFSWLPMAQNDAIFAVIGEELGLIGCVFVLGMFLALAWRGYRVAKRAPDTFGALVAVGIVTWIIFQAAINIGGITTTIPFSGIPLPFISYGGTALAVSLTAMGIVLNISRQTVAPERVPEPAPEAPPRRQRRREAAPAPQRAPAASHPTTSPRPRGAVRSVDGRSRMESGSFGRGRERQATRGRRHWG